MVSKKRGVKAKKKTKKVKKKATSKSTKKKTTKKTVKKKSSSSKKAKKKATKKKTTKKVVKKKAVKKKSSKKKIVKKKSSKKKAKKKQTKKKITKKSSKKKSSSVVIDLKKPKEEKVFEDNKIPNIAAIDIKPLLDESKFEPEILSVDETIKKEEPPVEDKTTAQVYQEMKTKSYEDQNDRVSVKVMDDTPGNVKAFRNVRPSWEAILSLILAIFLPPLGIILSIHAIHKIENDANLEGKRLAQAAFVIGIILTLAFGVYWFFLK